MGQAPSIPQRHWQRRLDFATDSLTSNILALEDLSLHYRLSTPSGGILRSKRVTSISRSDSRAPKDVLVAELEKQSFRSDRIRMSTGRHRLSSFVPLRRFLKLKRGWATDKFSFTASDGRRYSWKSRAKSLKLYLAGSGGLLVAQYFESGYLASRRGHIKLASGCEGILDEIIVTCLIAVKRRRNKKMSSPVV